MVFMVDVGKDHEVGNKGSRIMNRVVPAPLGPGIGSTVISQYRKIIAEPQDKGSVSQVVKRNTPGITHLLCTTVDLNNL